MREYGETYGSVLARRRAPATACMHSQLTAQVQRLSHAQGWGGTPFKYAFHQGAVVAFVSIKGTEGKCHPRIAFKPGERRA